MAVAAFNKRTWANKLGDTSSETDGRFLDVLASTAGAIPETIVPACGCNRRRMHAKATRAVLAPADCKAESHPLGLPANWLPRKASEIVRPNGVKRCAVSHSLGVPPKGGCMPLWDLVLAIGWRLLPARLRRAEIPRRCLSSPSRSDWVEPQAAPNSTQGTCRPCARHGPA